MTTVKVVPGAQANVVVLDYAAMTECNRILEFLLVVLAVAHGFRSSFRDVTVCSSRDDADGR